jgi:hypothetical protein
MPITNEEFIDELKARIKARSINIVVRHPSGDAPLILPASAICPQSADGIDRYSCEWCRPRQPRPRISETPLRQGVCGTMAYPVDPIAAVLKAAEDRDRENFRQFRIAHTATVPCRCLRTTTIRSINPPDRKCVSYG